MSSKTTIKHDSKAKQDQNHDQQLQDGLPYDESVNANTNNSGDAVQINTYINQSAASHDDLRDIENANVDS
jgi:hypothetical protein